jgi:hypothetical protein
MRVLFIVLSYLFCSGEAFSAGPPVVRWPGSETLLPSCLSFEASFSECLKLRAARQQAERITLGTTSERSGKTSVGRREVALVAFDRNEIMHVIMIDMPFEVRGDFVPRVLTMAEPPYTVVRERGRSLNKLVFRIFRGEEELFAYAAKHLLVETGTATGRSARGQTVNLRPTVYLATPPYLVAGDMASVGRSFLRSIDEGVMADLCLRGVRSKSFPGKLVCEVFSPDDSGLILAVEQTDPCFLRRRSRWCEEHIPVLPYPSDAAVVEAVFAEFAINGTEAYAYIGSAQGARGSRQFTNRASAGRLGTYDSVRAAYPDAGLNPDFIAGASDLANSGAATVLLLDLELASRRVSGFVRTAVARGDRLGLIVPGAAYNGGESESAKLSLLIERYRRERRIVSIDDFPWGEFLAWIDRAQPKLKTETRGYVEKLRAEVNRGSY